VADRELSRQGRGKRYKQEQVKKSNHVDGSWFCGTTKLKGNGSCEVNTYPQRVVR
jgi:hypothetical protein